MKTTPVSNDAHTYVTERTFTINTKIPEEKYVTNSRDLYISPSIRFSNSTRIYDALKAQLNSSELTCVQVCGLVILGILIIHFISLIAYLRIRKRAVPPSNPCPLPNQDDDDDKGKLNCDTRVYFDNDTARVDNWFDWSKKTSVYFLILMGRGAQNINVIW